MKMQCKDGDVKTGKQDFKDNRSVNILNSGFPDSRLDVYEPHWYSITLAIIKQDSNWLHIQNNPWRIKQKILRGTQNLVIYKAVYDSGEPAFEYNESEMTISYPIEAYQTDKPFLPQWSNCW